MNRLSRTAFLLVFIVVAATFAPANPGQAARVDDNHVCPLVTELGPHSGGPVLPPGVPNVLICGKPAAVVGTPVQCKGPLDYSEAADCQRQLLGSAGVQGAGLLVAIAWAWNNCANGEATAPQAHG